MRVAGCCNRKCPASPPKTSDGKVHMVTMSFKQDSLGGDSWGSLTARGLGLDNRTIIDYK